METAGAGRDTSVARFQALLATPGRRDEPRPRPELQQRPARADHRDDVRTLEAVERMHILRILDETNWTLGGPGGAAARLGMKRTTLQSMIKRLGITRPRAA